MQTYLRPPDRLKKARQLQMKMLPKSWIKNQRLKQMCLQCSGKFSPVTADGAVVEVLGGRGRADVAGGRQPEMWPNVSLRVELRKSQPEMWQVVRKRAWELHWQRAFLTREDFNCVSGFFATCKDKSSIQHERSSKPWIPPGGGGGGGASTLGHFTSLLWKLSLQEKEKEVRCGVSKDQSWLGLYYWKWY